MAPPLFATVLHGSKKKPSGEATNNQHGFHTFNVSLATSLSSRGFLCVRYLTSTRCTSFLSWEIRTKSGALRRADIFNHSFYLSKVLVLGKLWKRVFVAGVENGIASRFTEHLFKNDFGNFPFNQVLDENLVLCIHYLNYSNLPETANPAITSIESSSSEFDFVGGFFQTARFLRESRMWSSLVRPIRAHAS